VFRIVFAAELTLKAMLLRCVPGVSQFVMLLGIAVILFWRSHECERGTQECVRHDVLGETLSVLGRLHVEPYIFDVARLVEAHQALGERFDLVF